MGGSFNPAHGGHLHISLLALRCLDLDEVWWLVSPQNPLKPVAGMAPFAARLAEARRVAGRHPRIRVSDVEARLGTVFTADTLKALCRRFPGLDFVWLMGSDNLAQLPRWEHWTEIFETVPIAVFDRPSYSLRALAGLAARRFARHRVTDQAARRLAGMTPPAWAFFHTRLDLRSATAIRRARTPNESKEPQSELTTLAALAISARRQPTVAADLLRLILDTLAEGKAEDVVTIDLAGKAAFADYMVIASGRSARQVAALTEHLERALRGKRRLSIEGKAQGDWVLIDAGDVIVHLFRPEIRGYYNLEKMWSGDFLDSEAARQ